MRLGMITFQWHWRYRFLMIWLHGSQLRDAEILSLGRVSFWFHSHICLAVVTCHCCVAKATDCEVVGSILGMRGSKQNNYASFKSTYLMHCMKLLVCSSACDFFIAMPRDGTWKCLMYVVLYIGVVRQCAFFIWFQSLPAPWHGLFSVASMPPG